MKKTFENKKSIIAIACAIALVVVAVVAVAITTRQDDLEYAPKETNSAADVVAESSSTEVPVEEESISDEESSTTMKEEASAEEIEEATTKKAETTTKKETTTKAESTTKKAETTTKAVETTTKKASSTAVTYNGHKPYEVFTDENGIQVYYTETGRKCVAESLTAAAGETRDTSVCWKCGSEDCIRAMSSYYCTVCKETVNGSTCHPADHFNASH